MIFDIRQFEHYFKEKALKKGFKLFDKGLVSSEKKTAKSELHFLVNNAKIVFKKQGYKLISYRCSCTEKLCEHLSASLFYLQQEILGISKSRPHTNKYPFENNGFKLSKKNQKESVGYDLYKKSTKKIRETIKPYLDSGALSHNEIDSLDSEIAELFSEKERQEKNRPHNYYLELALASELPSIFNNCFVGDENKLKFLYQKTLSVLQSRYESGLNAFQKEAWFWATLASLRSNKIITHELFYFLLPRLIPLMDNKIQLQRINEFILKRKYKIQYPTQINKLHIGRLQISIREAALYKMPLVTKHGESLVELILAKSELDLSVGKYNRALKRLESNYQKIKTGIPEYFYDYLHYLINMARKAADVETEVKYLKEHLINTLFINEKELGYFFSLFSEKEKKKEADFLLFAFRNQNPEINFDKMATLLLYIQRYDELIIEISRRENKFHFLHEVAVAKWPLYDDKLLALYGKHLGEAFNSLTYFNLQKKIFDKAKAYLEKLPKEKAETVLTHILDKLPVVSPLYRYINTSF